LDVEEEEKVKRPFDSLETQCSLRAFDNSGSP
jgi:hypothetical protein